MSRESQKILTLLRKRDRILVKELEGRLRKRYRQTPFRNKAVSGMVPAIDSTRGLAALQKMLSKKGAFDLHVEKRRWQDTDGESRSVLIARATATDMWPMGTNYWVRDNAIVGARLLFGPPGKARSQGKRILLSALTIMSATTQLRRFTKIIRSEDRSFIKEPANWPHIFLSIANNLNGSRIEHWSHKQDAWQMLLFFTLEALDRRLLRVDELAAKMKRLLGLAIPFLAKVEFWKSENSGSWEEIPAVRASTIAWEHSLVTKIASRVVDPEYRFIANEFTKCSRYLGKTWARLNLEEVAKGLCRRASRAMLKTLPDESGLYPSSDARYRRADATLIYLLQLNYCELLARSAGRDLNWARSLERKLTARIDSLYDPITGGFFRYGNDSYQRNGFFRFSTVHRLNELYGAPSGDASEHQVGRDKVVPKGRKAAWAHPTWQYSAWAGRMFLRTGNEEYLLRHRELFVAGLRMITGDTETSIEQLAGVEVQLIGIPAYRVPECYISDRAPDGRPLVFPSPHTPLNWAVVEMADAFFVRQLVLASTHGK